MSKQAKSWTFGEKVQGYAWEVATPRANLLLQHGYGEYAGRFVTSYNRLIPNLNALDINVYAFDAEGHGRSPGARGATDMKRAVAHHLAARDMLEEREEPLFLMGHSLGGLITAASVAYRPEGVSGTVLSAPALKIELNPVLKAIAGLVASIAPTARLTPPLDDDAISRDAAVVETYRNDPMVITRPPAARLGATVFKVLERAWEQFPDWDVPVLVVHGDADRVTPIEGSRAFIETIGEGDKQLVEFPGGYHELLNDYDADKALATVLDWLKPRLPGGKV
ncbi:lysophospholipase [Henriciella sp. AS95]|uniref:alpha/beta hydrolase n=1 Tax=Henriciella sp. AS95 TaxID=3135782 RepID=UPI003177AF5D